jgi:FKBP-type peptidyl-prolyl cis-trans isomerase (trigger factor)
MLIRYRGLGLASCVALVCYVLLYIVFLAIIPSIQLTLPGIAGILLAIGMAVDANIVIFERIREEYRLGKTEEAAVKQAETSFENGIMNAIIEKIDSPIPNCMFERRIDELVQNFDMTLRQQGMNLDIYFQYTGMDMDSFRDTHRERAINEVKLRLGLEKIAEIEKLEVSEEDINKGLAEIAEANKMDVEAVKKLIPMEEYKNDLLVQKAIELVKENAIVDNTIAEKAEDAE